MDRSPVNSRNLKSVGYDMTAAVLEIEFWSEQRVYQYFGVPSLEYQGLMSAPSLGKYHRRHIIDTYRFQRVR